MFKNAIVGVDGQQGGRDAILLASVLVAAGGKLTLAHVRAGEDHVTRAANLDYDAVERADSSDLLQREREASGLDVQTLSIACPDVGRGLHRLAEEHGADLVVVGSCTRGPVGRIFAEDDTRATLNESDCAVAVAPRGYRSDRHPISCIGVGYESALESGAALTLARSIATERHASIKVLTVIEPPIGAYVNPAPIGPASPAPWAPKADEIPDHLIEAAQAQIDDLEGVSGVAVFGSVGEELVRFSERVDLLVVGSRGKGCVGGRLLPKSVLGHLIGHLHCALLARPSHVAAEPSPRRVGGSERPAAASDEQRFQTVS
jgi:nucleotide-binding universal stress UspA family protein